jgi:hypothetical protein
VRCEAGVVEHSAPVAVSLDADQRGETMLSNQLLRRAEVPRLVASHALLTGHQHVEEVVDHDRHLDTINRGEHTPILRQPLAPANEAGHRHRFRCLLPALRKGSHAGMLLRNEGARLERALRPRRRDDRSSSISSVSSRPSEAAALPALPESASPPSCASNRNATRRGRALAATGPASNPGDCTSAANAGALFGPDETPEMD